MSHDLILLPMGALALLTFLVLLFVPVRRFRAAFAGQVGAGDFRYGESSRVPGEVSIPNRNYMNLLELPVLFYVVCVLNYITSPTVSGLTLALAWAYVGLRVMHSLIHLTYNNVMHRLAAFAASNFVLMAMWIVFFASRLPGSA
ncbi:MAG TPA: MAPEG family protein [Rhizomicrobium sp.]|nr:MAPEG family protein [Rhizomicrobium sp.]